MPARLFNQDVDFVGIPPGDRPYEIGEGGEGELSYLLRVKQVLNRLWFLEVLAS